MLSSSSHLYGHGGPVYWAVTSLLLCLAYLLLLLSLLLPSSLLPSLLPPSPSLTLYTSTQLALHSLTAAGALMLVTNHHFGLCLTNMTSFVSFSLLSPLVFCCFLHDWLATSRPSLLFAYKAQQDWEEEDVASVSAVQSFRHDQEEEEKEEGEMQMQASFVSDPIYNASVR